MKKILKTCYELRLMRFGVYFETKMAIFINNYSLFALIYARGSGPYVTRENFENMVQFCAFWYIF